MIGILFLFTVALWLIGSFALAVALGRFVPNSRWRWPVGFAALLVFLSAPFADEVVGRRQFQALCKANGIEGVDVSKARGRRVKVRYGERRPVDGTAVPIREGDVQFVDATTGELLFGHRNYYASGGWVMRYTWLNMGSKHPMLFDGSTCDIGSEQLVFRKNEITLLYK